MRSCRKRATARSTSPVNTTTGRPSVACCSCEKPCSDTKLILSVVTAGRLRLWSGTPPRMPHYRASFCGLLLCESGYVVPPGIL